MDNFDLRKYLIDNPLLETEGFEKNTWAELTDREKEEFADEIINLIGIAYEPIGGHPNYKDISDVTGAEKNANYMVIDLDDDPEFDALKVTKDKPAGNKSVAMGHDGTKPAKSAAINITALMLKEPGQYVEVSGKLKDILASKGVPLITDEETIRRVMKGKDIKLNSDGTYSRMIGGERHTKTLMGNPK